MNFDEFVKFEFSRLNSRMERLENLIRGLPTKSHETLGDWLNEQQAQELLCYKATSLWSLRKTKKIVSSKINGKNYYSKESIIRYLEKNKSK